MDWFLLVPFGSAYLIPTIIAMRRHHRNAIVIASVNIVLGWTILGWAISLVWALSHNTRERHVPMMYDLGRPDALSSYDRTHLPRG